MKYVLILFFIAATCAFADPHRIVVERPATVKDTTQSPVHFLPATDSTGRRMILDPGELVYQERVDSINDSAERQIRAAITGLEKEFQDPKTEELVGSMIGNIILEQQMALLDIQVDRAVNLRDTLLLRGLELAFHEILKNVPQVREELLRQVQGLEQKFREMEIQTEAVRK